MASMRGPMILLVYITLTLTGINGQPCNVPPNWYENGGGMNQRWWSGYTGNDDFLGRPRPHLYSFNTSFVLDLTTPVTVECENGGSSRNSDVYVGALLKEGLLGDPANRKRFCFEGFRFDNAIMYRALDEVKRNTSLLLDECFTSLDDAGRVMWELWLKYPVTLTPPMDQTDVPPQDYHQLSGTFQTVYTVGEIETIWCENDASSTVEITPSNLNFRTCTNEDTFAEPFRRELAIVAHTTFGRMMPGDAANVEGGFLGLAKEIRVDRPGNARDYTLYEVYCATYIIKEFGLELFFSVETKNSSTCVSNQINFKDTVKKENQYLTFTATSDECSSDPCANGGTCQQNWKAYTCVCAPGWTGTNCDQDINECIPNPCENGGTCRNRLATYECQCITGWTGINCDEVDYCAGSPCENGGTCINVPQISDFRCRCQEGFSGKTCTDQDPCRNDPCLNGGTCYFQPGSSEPFCSCPAPYTGSDCSQTPGPCNPNPCLNGGTCFASGITFLCQCDGYTGDRCQTPIASGPCEPNPCLNGGTCFSSGSDFQCQCVAGNWGDRCEMTATGVLLSGNVPCTASSVLDTQYTCVKAVDGSQTAVLSEWASAGEGTGSYITLNFPTASEVQRVELLQRCRDRDQFTAVNLLFDSASTTLGTLDCWGGASETDCSNERWESFDISPPRTTESLTFVTAGTPCTGNIQGNTGFKEIRVWGNYDSCSSGPCSNGGTCFNSGSSYVCQCVPPYTGLSCTTLEPCGSSPCLNGGTCTSSAGTYTCQCLPGYTGVRCETSPPDPCQSAPCLNGGTCFPNGASTPFICSCEAGFTGPRCACQDLVCDNDCGEPGYGRKLDALGCPTCECHPDPCVDPGIDCPDEEVCSPRPANCLVAPCDPPYVPTCVGGPGDCSDERDCQNGGSCFLENGVPACQCVSYWTGDNCTEWTDWFIAAIVLIALLGLVLFILLVLCLCYTACGWRPNQGQAGSMYSDTRTLETTSNGPSFVNFNFAQASPYQGIKVIDSA